MTSVFEKPKGEATTQATLDAWLGLGPRGLLHRCMDCAEPIAQQSMLKCEECQTVQAAKVGGVGPWFIDTWVDRPL